MSEQPLERATEMPSAMSNGAGSQSPATPDLEDSLARQGAPEAPAKLVPVSEAIKYRRRAQQAESRLQQIEQQLSDVQAQFEERMDQLAVAEAQRDELQHQLEATRARTCAERMLYDAKAIDVEAALALLEKRISFDQEVDADELSHAVGQLLRDKPFLTAPPALPSKTASPRLQTAGLGARLAQAASRAASTGNSKDVAEYLRLRRQT